MNLTRRAGPDAARSGAAEPATERGAAPADITTVLGRGSYFEGKLAFEGSVQIQGVFVGEIHSKDTLVVGDGGRLQGRMEVGTLIVHGEVVGEVRARELVEMRAPARVRATVQTPVLVIDRGVVFEGTTKMENLDAAAREPGGPPAPRPAAA